MNKIGFTFDEKILNDYTLDSFFNILPIDSIDSIELSPDDSILDLSIYKAIAKTIEKNNQSINFHVPYFANKTNYDFSSEKSIVIKHYTKLFSIIESLRQYSVKIPSLVIHGATIIDDNHNLALYKSLSSIDFLLNFISKKNIDINISLESLSNNSNEIGRSREEVISVIKEFNTKSLGICWDLCHDYYNFDNYYLPNNKFLDNVNYVHIHGKNNNIKHVSFKKYFNYDYFLKNYDFKNVINIEILKDLCGNTYYDDLINDINLLKKKWSFDHFFLY